MAVSVAILYAGRWFGRAGQHFVDNHLDYSSVLRNALPRCRSSWWCLQTSGAPPLAPMTRWPRCSVQA